MDVSKMINNRIVLTVLMLLYTPFALMGQQKGSAVNDNPVIIEVGKEQITAKDLQKAYQKNLNRNQENLFATTKDSIMDFINLYTNFRLKVNDAKSRGYESDSSVIADIKQNRKILSESFYYDKKLTEPWVDFLVEKRKSEYQVGVILVPIKYNPDPDTATAYAKINQALNDLKAGKSFEETARKYSEDMETANRGGLIPNYITSGKVQRPIEMAIFSTPKGSFFPEIIKTSFGYFIVKVFDVSDRVLVDAKQILISINETRDSATAFQKADSLYKLLKNGADFGKIATENSDDKLSAAKGGSLGEHYSRSTGLESSGYPLVGVFENNLYSLKDGEISKPFKSEFGYHIIQRLASKQADFLKEKADIRKVYKRLYFEDDKKAHIDSLKKVYNFKINDVALNKLTENLDTIQTNLKDKWDEKVDKSIYPNTLYSVAGKDYNVEYFLDRLEKQADLRGVPTNNDGFVKAVNILVEPFIFNKATENMEKEYSDFAELMREFTDGILLFKVEALEVWDKLKFDSTQAKRFFDSLPKKFYTDDMYDATEVFILSDSSAKDVYNRIKNGADIKSIAQKETQREGFREKMGEWGLQSVKTNPIARHIKDMKAKPGDLLEPFKNGTGFSIIKVNSYQPPRIKKFEESISDIAPLYQEMLQKELSKKWIDKIKKSFPVKINEKNISELMKSAK